VIGARTPLDLRRSRAKTLSLRRPALRRPRLRTLLLLALLAVVLGAGWFWVRDSSLVAVRQVEVTGIDGAQAPSVRAALDEAARSMTTLHVRRSALETAVAPYSVVKEIEVSTSFPRTLRIHVVTNVAVAAIERDGRRIPVTSDGTLLRDLPAAKDLATVPLRNAPGGRRLTEPDALAAVAALAAAPASLRSRIASVATTKAEGLTVQIANGPAIWLGDRERLRAKWTAAIAVLADPGSAGATYVDVAAPERPAVGGLPGGAPATGDSDVPTLPDGATAADGSSGATGPGTASGTAAGGSTDASGGTQITP
jgi:cell division protein FtsQ